ncbi:MAG TPA: phosphate/phosphite/phosphonate ABC transporter substrate-binding protein [Tepidiformaceae bacterium]|nr:phosphate/phosphite/phosphonate ABC transporter substrate-binding protein [Tepidiformaceae bacterium]
MRLRKFALFLGAALVLAGMAVASACGGDDDDGPAPTLPGGTPAPTATPTTPPDPFAGKKLRFGLLPSEDAEKVLEEAGYLEAYLEAQLKGLDVDLFIGPNYAATIAAMKEGDIDFAYFGPFSYYIARTAGAKAEAAMAFQNGDTEPGYYSILYTRRSTGITNVNDLKGKEGSFDWALVDPGSTSGNLAPRAMMYEVGLNVGEIDKKLIYAGGHDKSALATADGQTQVGASFEAMLYDLCNKGAIPGIADVVGGGQFSGDCGNPNADGALVLLKKFLLPASPIAYRTDMDPVLSQAVIDAMLVWWEVDPEGFKKFAEVTEGLDDADSRLVAYNHSNYKQIEDMCNRPELKDICPKPK